MPKRIDTLTAEQKARFPEWIEKWTAIGLKTGETDWENFEKYIPMVYEKAGIKYPKNVVRVQSPIVGALASSLSSHILKSSPPAVHSAVGSAVRSAVGSAVDSAVGSAVDSAKLTWHHWFGGQFWVGGWWGSPSLVSYFTDVCELKLEKDIQERATIYQELCESANYFWTNTSFVMVCARPVKILMDERGRLHSEAGKAIEYPDTWGLYMLHGVQFEEKLWKSIVEKTITSKKALAIKSSDQRAIALQYLGGEKLMKDFDGKVIATDEYGELIELPKLIDGNGQAYKYLKAWNPESKDFVFLRTWPEVKTAAEAEAKSYSLDRFKMVYAPNSRT